MGKDSALYQLMVVRMNGIMNDITNSDGEYQEIVRKTEEYILHAIRQSAFSVFGFPGKYLCMKRYFFCTAASASYAHNPEAHEKYYPHIPHYPRCGTA